MTERDAILRAIAADPADDTVRLAFADWLDEHDETERAEFIRLQIKRERSGRKSKSSDLSPREKTLLSKHKTQWFGPIANLKSHEGFEYTVRRGFVESAVIHGRLLQQHAEVLRNHCPALTELDVIGVRGFGEQIANEIPSGIRTLCLEDWPFPDDAKVIAKSPNFAHLEALSFWLGSQNDEAVCRALGAPRAFPALRQLELVQLAGGIDAFGSGPELDARADRLAGVLNAQRKTTIATVYRPCSELLPLAPHVGWYLHGGTVPDGRQALLFARINKGPGSCIVFYFDGAGHLLNGERIELSGTMHRKPKYGGYDENELFERMGERIGFRPGLIRVHEFDTEQVVPGTSTRIYKFDGTAYEFIEGVDDLDREWFEGRESLIDYVRHFLRDGSFCITHGGDAAWAGQDGTIHST
jgi:uncharacterized protein (TIGR02996 family)